MASLAGINTMAFTGSISIGMGAGKRQNAHAGIDDWDYALDGLL
jgi:hypothetical protein